MVRETSSVPYFFDNDMFLRKKLPTGTIVENFITSNIWFTRYKQRAQLHNVAVRGESASADIEVAEAFKVTFATIVEEGGYTPQKIFNVDETSIF